MLLIAIMAIQSVAIDTDNEINPQQVFRFGPHQPGDLREEYDLFLSESYKPLFPVKYTTAPVSFNNDIVELIEQINETMIYSYIENLTSFGPRVTATQACEDAGKYLYQEFHDMGLSVRYHNWSYAPDYYGSNIEATLPGDDPENDFIFVVCAHYDSVPGAPGANDDASGVAAVLASANIMRQYSFNHTVRFVLFPGEEQGLHGSYYYAEQAYRNGDHIIGTLNADAIAYATNSINGSKVDVIENEESAWITNYSTEIAQIYNEYIGLEIFPYRYTPHSSDHYRFWQFGYDAIWYMENEHSPYWHTPDDVVENCNMTYTKRVSRLILATLADLAQSYQGESPIDIPTWKIGDKWTYHFDIYADFGVTQKEVAYGTSDNMVYTVVDCSGDEYKLKFKGRFSGWIKAPFATIRITRLSIIKGDLIIQKSDLAIKEWNMKINGITLPMSGNIPIPLPLPLQMGINVELSPAYRILPFPLYDGKHGILPDSTLNHSGFISLLFGKLFDFELEWIIEAHDHPYRCDKEIISVNAGTFDAYEIITGFIGLKVENHYAPEVGNMIKQEIWVNKGGFLDQTGIEIKQELISTTYEP